MPQKTFVFNLFASKILRGIQKLGYSYFFLKKIKVKLGLYKLQINFKEAINLPLTLVCFFEFDGHIEIGNDNFFI